MIFCTLAESKKKGGDSSGHYSLPPKPVYNETAEVNAVVQPGQPVLSAVKVADQPPKSDKSFGKSCVIGGRLRNS